MSKIKNIGIYGLGNFGFALLNHLSCKRSGTSMLRAFDRSGEVRACMKEYKNHPFLFSGVSINENVIIVNTPQELVNKIDLLIIAIPSNAIKETFTKIGEYIENDTIILNTAKGLDETSGKRPSELIREILGKKSCSYAFISGGTIASDLMNQDPLGIDLACDDSKIATELKRTLESENLSVYPTGDVLGVEYAGSLKNIIAIVAGIINGLGLSYGSETHIISRLGQSLANICIQMGADRDTFSIGSQCWGNDLWMSCTGNTRNREFGKLLGRGMNVEHAVKKMESEHKTVEGVSTLKSLAHNPVFMSLEIISDMFSLIVDKNMDVDAFNAKLIRTI